MWDRIQRLTMPAVEPVTLAEAKAQRNFPSSDDDAFFTRAIQAARQVVEGPDGAGLALVASQWMLPLDSMPAEIWIPMGPVISIDFIRYRDEAGVLQTLDPARYQWRKGTYEARIKPAYGRTWPPAREQYDAVQVTFTAGHAGTEQNPSNLAAIPAPLIVAMLMLIGHWHANRETVAVGVIPAEIQLGFNELVNRYRVGRFG